MRAAVESLIKSAPKLEKLVIPGDVGMGLVRAATTEVLVFEACRHMFIFVDLLPQQSACIALVRVSCFQRTEKGFLTQL